ncbi:MAG: hypothetical protein ACO2O2_13525 [Acidilobaceae archaeon]
MLRWRFFTFWGLRVLVRGGLEEVERKLKEAIGGEPRGVPPLRMIFDMTGKSGVEVYACSTTMQTVTELTVVLNSCRQ